MIDINLTVLRRTYRSLQGEWARVEVETGSGGETYRRGVLWFPSEHWEQFAKLLRQGAQSESSVQLMIKEER